MSAVVRKLAGKVMWISSVKPVPQPEVEALLARVASAEEAFAQLKSAHDALSAQFKGFMEEFTEVPRLQVRDLRVLPDADNDGNSVPPRNSRFLPVSEEPQLSAISVPHENQHGEDFFPTLVKGPVGPSGTGSSEETPIMSPPVFAREVPAENPRPSPKQEADGPQLSPAEEPRLQGRGLRKRAGAGYEDTPMPPSNPRSLSTPRQTLENEMPDNQIKEDTTSALGRWPAGSSVTRSTEENDADDDESSVPPGTSGSVPIRSPRTELPEEALSASQLVLVSDEQADRSRSSPAQDSEIAATVGAGALRRKKKRQPKRNPPTDDDALLDSMIESATRERDELESLAQTNVLTLETTLARKGMVCPEDHPASVRAVTNATSNCCFRCSSVHHLGEVRGCCIPCDFMICGSCVETFAGGHHCHCHDSGSV